MTYVTVESKIHGRVIPLKVSDGVREYSQIILGQLAKFNAETRQLMPHEGAMLMLRFFCAIMLIGDFVLWVILTVNDYRAVSNAVNVARMQVRNV